MALAMFCSTPLPSSYISPSCSSAVMSPAAAALLSRSLAVREVHRLSLAGERHRPRFLLSPGVAALRRLLIPMVRIGEIARGNNMFGVW